MNLNILAQFDFVLCFKPKQLLYSWPVAAIKMTLQRVLSPGGEQNNILDTPILLIVICNLLIVEGTNLLNKLMLRCSADWIGTGTDERIYKK